MIRQIIKNNTFAYVTDKNSEEYDKKASEIMKQGVHYKDAIHIACAIAAKCDYLLTTDDRMLRFKSDEIKVVSPIDFIVL